MPFFLMRCLHHPDMDLLRDEMRPRHREWVGGGGRGLVSVLIGSALIDEAGRSSGNFGILEAKTRADAEAFANGDPFSVAGIVATVEVTPLPATFQADRIGAPMSPRLGSG
ncbi:YciI family protein [Martelella soudanensis]|uniref:YciI family protein n=1 Tax=unclassified Martelella TaxID=2629616 RepID=UPI0015DF9BA6|nr:MULTISPECIES: YciI family protein [unclassified Martelella]